MFTTDKIKPLTLDTYEKEVLEAGEVPVVVDFWGKTCAPCQVLARRLSSQAEFLPEVKFFSVCVEDNLELVKRLGVRTMPTLFLYWKGRIVFSINNLNQYDDFVIWLMSVRADWQTGKAPI